ncbi:rRNA pseudouridine synthase [Candidatus Shapirobacteria bacterium]|jgi:23S rRNA pseudouridine2605 synthase|nr:rRNA pseudouridine synthase [Candidatus Shapirobacteria bacterium]HQI13208.1 pseudouridine synthase [Candidatus Woesebacteria bacterium]
MRLNKFLAQSGVASRRGADKIIAEGRVKINGIVAKLGDQVGARDKVFIDEKPIGRSEEKQYFAVYKPVGYISTVSDEFGRKNVLQLVKSKNRLYPVGRLDIDSEGLMILTNDGDLTLKLTHPRFHLEKEYEVTCDREINVKKINTGANKIIWYRKNEMRIVMYEGKKRQIRKMCWLAGLRVIKLKRIRIGKLFLGNLNPGEYKELTPRDVKELSQI